MEKIHQLHSFNNGCPHPAHFHTEFYSSETKLLVRVQLEKALATHSSTLAWKIPWAEEPGRLQSMGLLRVGHD